MFPFRKNVNNRSTLKGAILVSVAERGFGLIEKNISGPSANVIRLQISALNGEELLLVLECLSLNPFSQILTLASRTRIYM